MFVVAMDTLASRSCGMDVPLHVLVVGSYRGRVFLIFVRRSGLREELPHFTVHCQLIVLLYDFGNG